MECGTGCLTSKKGNLDFSEVIQGEFVVLLRGINKFNMSQWGSHW
jgi:hypothetical protein